MRITSYLKEKWHLLILSFLFTCIAFLFLYATNVQHAVITILLLLFWMIIIATLIIEYARRAPFYYQLHDTLEHLDQKYLVTEMLDEPDFADGRELYECMQTVNKAMTDHVNEFKHAQQDYKEYIEMWVHEIKTPLAAAHLILTNNPSSVSQSLKEEIEKIEGFVEQALFYARSTNPEKDYMINQLSLQSVVSKTIKRHSKTFIYKNIKLTMKDLEIPVFCDSKWLEFILHLIINNALTYTQANGAIDIRAIQKSQQVILSIQDNGIGINEQDLGRVFDKGFTGSNGRSNEKSTGMGLYLCKKLCEKLYLEIQLTSNKKGTCVTIIFPISDMMLFR